MSNNWIRIIPLDENLPILINLDNVCSIKRTEVEVNRIIIFTIDGRTTDVQYSEKTWNSLYVFVNPILIP